MEQIAGGEDGGDEHGGDDWWMTALLDRVGEGARQHDVVSAQRATHSLFGRPWITITFMTAQIAECRMIGVRMSGGRVRFR